MRPTKQVSHQPTGMVHPGILLGWSIYSMVLTTIHSNTTKGAIIMGKEKSLKKLNAVIKEFPLPMLDRSVLQQILTNSASKEDPQSNFLPIRKRRMHPSILDQHFYELMKILLPDPSKPDPKSTKDRLSLQAVADQLMSKTGISIAASTLKRYLDNHPTLKCLYK